ncbi:MAG TPA: hypothetical protein ENO24_05885, partial [Chloroflexi bacterium]|nr:hypothetical protein [Chloroflexota bacterium]
MYYEATNNSPYKVWLNVYSGWSGASGYTPRRYNGIVSGDCPQSGGVILYWNDNYNCDNGEGDPGYRQATSAGSWNTSGAFDDDASSVRVPSGWSVMLFKDPNRGGSSRCRSSDDDNFAGNTFLDGSTLNDSVSCFDVFNNSNCSPYPVTLYPDHHYTGSWCAAGSEGCFYCDGLDNAASSVRVWPGWSVRIYQDRSCEGASRCFASNDSDFADNTFEGGTPLNDQMSSFRVFHNTSCDSPPQDSTPPTGRITSPSSGWATNSCPFTIYADASDDQSGVDRVEFHVRYDGSWHHVGDDTSSPYSISWDCSLLSDQKVDLTIHVLDEAGNETMDPGGYVDVILDRTGPSGAITSPSPNDTLDSSPTIIRADASDSLSGVARVEFHARYSGSWHHLGDDTVSPYTWLWDWSGVPDQAADLTIHVRDIAGNESMDPGGYVRVVIDRSLPAPTNLTATSGSQSQIDLQWDDNSTDESNFHVERSLDGATGWTQIGYTAEDANETTYSDTGLSCDTTYYYRVRAHRHSDGKYSDYSNVASASTHACCADANEPNDVPGQATSISYSAWQHMGLDICPPGDVDYYAFEGNAGDEIIADAMAGGSYLDPYLYLHDVDGVTVLAENDDYNELDSHIQWTLPENGTYYLKVREYDHPFEGGPDYWYWLSLSAGGPNLGPLVHSAHLVDDHEVHQTVGDGDNVADCAETVEIYVTLQNQGLLTANAVTATLTTTDPYLS